MSPLIEKKQMSMTLKRYRNKMDSFAAILSNDPKHYPPKPWVDNRGQGQCYKTFQPSVMFVGKAEAYPREAPFRSSTLG